MFARKNTLAHYTKALITVVEIFMARLWPARGSVKQYQIKLNANH
jgi:hypothetical protein